MHTINPAKRTIGVTVDKNLAHITLWSPHADSIELLINDQTKLPLLKQEYGYWYNSTSQLKAGDQYEFIINGKKKLPDPASLSQPLGVHASSMVVDEQAFDWTDQSWKNTELDSYIIYELHTGTYTDIGNFEGILKKLDHLLELGITAIELMPVATFPGNRNWGYDGVFPFAVHSVYGGAAELQKLVNQCHKKGLAVILDVVYNHLGPEGNYLPEFAPYLTDNYKTPWGKAMNFDDAACDGVRKYFIENALMWLRDFHVDALRLDAVHAIKDFSAEHFLAELRHYVNQLGQVMGKNYYLLIECDLNDPKYISSLDENGYGMHAQWSDEFHHALRVTAGQQAIGYYKDFKGIEHLAKAFKDAYVYDGIYSSHREKKFGLNPKKNTGEQFIVFSQNHDQVGNRMLGERSASLVSFEMLKLMAGTVMVSPFIPLLFMGEEWAEQHPFLYFVSHTDPQLAEAVRKGRKEEFKSFHNLTDPPDPMAEETFKRSCLQWELNNKQKHAIMFEFYKRLISIRKYFLPLNLFKREQLEINCDPLNNTLQLLRWKGRKQLNGNNQIACMMNFSKTDRILKFPSDQNWSKIFCSSDPDWLGEVRSSELITGDDDVLLAAESFLIYINKHV
jgi:maltooligosyltrehalose trehalohydrolase